MILKSNSTLLIDDTGGNDTVFNVNKIVMLDKCDYCVLIIINDLAHSSPLLGPDRRLLYTPTLECCSFKH